MVKEYAKKAVYALVDRLGSLEEAFKEIRAVRERELAAAAAEWNETVAPVKHILDAMPEALKLKAQADKKYALRVKPMWEEYDRAFLKAKERWKKIQGRFEYDEPEEENNDEEEQP